MMGMWCVSIHALVCSCACVHLCMCVCMQACVRACLCACVRIPARIPACMQKLRCFVTLKALMQSCGSHFVRCFLLVIAATTERAPAGVISFRASSSS